MLRKYAFLGNNKFLLEIICYYAILCTEVYIEVITVCGHAEIQHFS